MSEHLRTREKILAPLLAIGLGVGATACSGSTSEKPTAKTPTETAGPTVPPQTAKECINPVDAISLLPNGAGVILSPVPNYNVDTYQININPNSRHIIVLAHGSDSAPPVLNTFDVPVDHVARATYQDQGEGVTVNLDFKPYPEPSNEFDMNIQVCKPATAAT